MRPYGVHRIALKPFQEGYYDIADCSLRGAPSKCGTSGRGKDKRGPVHTTLKTVIRRTWKKRARQENKKLCIDEPFL